MKTAFAWGVAILLLVSGAVAAEEPKKSGGRGGGKDATRSDPVGLQEAPRWYAATMAADEHGGFLVVHFWSRGSLLRSEAVIGGRKIVTIVNRERYIVVDAVLGKGVSIARSPEARALAVRQQRPFGNELDALLEEGGERIRSEQVGDQTVDVYRLTDYRGRRTLWVSQSEPPLPLRMETFDRETSTTGRVDYAGWRQNPVIPPGFFDPNPDWKLEEISYKQYRERIVLGPVGPAPVLYRNLLHGESTD